MKKILIIALLIVVGGGVFVLMKKNSTTPPSRQEGKGEVTEPSPVPAANPEPTPAPPANPPPAGGSTPPAASTPPPAGGSTQDNMGDVDVAPPKVINITGRNFSFSQAEIKVKKGDRVIINFESTDGFHDWVADEFNAHTERVSTGQKSSVEFIADKTGTFEYYCSVSSHRAMGMKGRLVVE